MRKIALILAAALVAVPTASALDLKQAKALLRLASEASGLKPRAQVKIVVERPQAFAKRRVLMLDRTYPRRAQEFDEAVYRALGLLDGERGALRHALLEVQNRSGYYDHVTKTTFVRKGPTERAAALHELVHALQDQHFGVGRLFSIADSRDRKVAALAAVEGHARLVSDVIAPTRRLLAHGGPKLQRFLELEHGFLYDVGLRFAADLRNLGGQQAVRGSLRRFPATSEQVFHLDKYLEREPAKPIVLPVEAAGTTLLGTNTFGELDVRALLAVFGVPRLDHVGSGWGGGRTALYRGAGGDAVAVVLEWDTDTDALQWAEAVATWVNEAFDAQSPQQPPLHLCRASACWQIGARGIAFERQGTRTALVLGTVADRTAELALALAPVQ